MKLRTFSKWMIPGMLAIGLLLPSLAFAGRVPAWLLLSPDHNDSVLTLAAMEKDVLVKAGWQVEALGAVEAESVPGSALLHRLIRQRPEGVTRVLESDPTQLTKWQKAGYVEEGLLGNVAAEPGAGRIPVVQFTKNEGRLWLVQKASEDAAEARGWRRQGVQFWLWPVPTE